MTTAQAFHAGAKAQQAADAQAQRDCGRIAILAPLVPWLETPAAKEAQRLGIIPAANEFEPL